MPSADSNTAAQDRNDAENAGAGSQAGGQMGYGNSRSQDGQMEQDVALSQIPSLDGAQHIVGETSDRPNLHVKAAANRPLYEGDRG